jgi:hypothetical protein
MLDLFLNPTSVFRIITIIACTGGIISSSEFVAIRKEFAPSGLLTWEVIRADYIMSTKKSMGKVLDILYSSNIWWLILVSRVFLFSSLLVITIFEVKFGAVFILGMIVLTTLIINFRVIYGMDGSDQMLSIIFITLFAQSLFPSDKTINKICLWFISVQSLSSYFIAGIAKAFSKVWLKGEAVSLIMTTESYGKKYFAEILIQYPVLGKLATWITIIMECTFPLVLLGNPVLLIVYFVWGITFHFLNSIVMGLNVFIWAFISTYPALIYCIYSYA